MSVEAKFVVHSIIRSKGWGTIGEIQTIKFSPVTGGSEENNRFYATTPSGSIELGIVNKEAGDYFDLSGEYRVTFEKVEKS